MMKAFVCAGLSVGAATAAGAQTFQVTFSTPTLDRWMYPFVGNGGTRAEAPIFGPVLDPQFDDRDAEFIVGFNTAPSVPSGRSPSRYVVEQATLTVFVSQGGRFEYDPTFDDVWSSLAPTDPQFVADGDTGKPIEVFALAYRNGFTNLSWMENSPFSPFGFAGPYVRVRNAYPAVYSLDGSTVTDVSNPAKDKINLRGLAVGQANLTPGALVPEETAFSFDLASADPAGLAYIQRSLAEGRLLLTVTSLHSATGGPGGGTSVTYPVFYTKENALSPILGVAPKLELTVRVLRSADFNESGGVADIDDIVAFFDAFNAGDPSSDFDGSGGVSDIDDILAFFDAFNNP